MFFVTHWDYPPRRPAPDRSCKTMRVLARQDVILPMPRCRRARPRLAGPLREGSCRQGMFAALYDYRVGRGPAQACSGFGPDARGGGMTYRTAASVLGRAGYRVPRPAVGTGYWRTCA